MKPGDHVIVDAWANPAEARRCWFNKDDRFLATLESEEPVVSWGTKCLWVVTKTGHKILAPVSCITS